VVNSSSPVGIAAIQASLQANKEVLACSRTLEAGEVMWKHVGVSEVERQAIVSCGKVDASEDASVQNFINHITGQPGQIQHFQHAIIVAGRWGPGPSSEEQPGIQGINALNEQLDGLYSALRLNLDICLDPLLMC
jgi:hypothetical protein